MGVQRSSLAPLPKAGTRGGWTPMFSAGRLSLAVNAAEGLFYFSSDLGGRRNQGQPRRPPEVALRIHQVLQPGDAVLRRNNPGPWQEAVLPVARRFLLAGSVRLPHRHASVRDGVRNGQDGSH